jgi:hypothetical protein
VAVMVFTHSQFASHESREKLISIRIIRYVLFRNLPKYRGAKICSINSICRRTPLHFSKILANGTELFAATERKEDNANLWERHRRSGRIWSLIVENFGKTNYLRPPQLNLWRQLSV